MPSTFDTMVGKRIKKQRMEINYSQEQLAASTNCSYRCIQKWESGKTMPRAQKPYMFRLTGCWVFPMTGTVNRLPGKPAS